MYRAFAEREAGLFEQVLLPYRRQRNPEAQARTARDARRALGARPAAAHRAAAPGRAALAQRLTCPPTILLDADAVAGARRAGSAREIERDHPDGVVLIGVLKGALIFVADLARAITGVPVELDFISISRFAPDSGRVKILHDLESDIGGRDVVVVEDIVDTGLTLAYLIGQLASAGPAVAVGVHAARSPVAADRAARPALPRARARRRVRARLRPARARSVPQPAVRRGRGPRRSSRPRPTPTSTQLYGDAAGLPGRTVPGPVVA